MRPSNAVIVRGRIARDVTLEQTSGGTSVLDETLSEGIKDDSVWQEIDVMSRTLSFQS